MHCGVVQRTTAPPDERDRVGCGFRRLCHHRILYGIAERGTIRSCDEDKSFNID
jgi:hypothetical protein